MKIEIDLGPIYLYTETSLNQTRVIGLLLVFIGWMVCVFKGIDSNISLVAIALIEAAIYAKRKTSRTKENRERVGD